ncbi:MAG: hypothetical protein JWP44_4604 [Mucilaginibacter sp.]|nr:hypothetical protein [Mucilaginibacter sp.]
MLEIDFNWILINYIRDIFVLIIVLGSYFLSKISIGDYGDKSNLLRYDSALWFKLKLIGKYLIYSIIVTFVFLEVLGYNKPNKPFVEMFILYFCLIFPPAIYPIIRFILSEPKN